jgi:hypothetical protein
MGENLVMNKKICYRDRATAKMANWIEECFLLCINAFDISMIVL